MKRLFATTLRTHFSLIILITTFDLFVPRLVHQHSLVFVLLALVLACACVPLAPSPSPKLTPYRFSLHVLLAYQHNILRKLIINAS